MIQWKGLLMRFASPCLKNIEYIKAYTTHAMKILLLVLIFVDYALALCHLCSSFFLQQAVTQPKALVATTTVNMTWKAPMYGFQNVAFWYGTMHGCSCASFSYSICPLCALNICAVEGLHNKVVPRFGCISFTYCVIW